MQNVTLPAGTPASGKVTVKVEVSAEMNVTSFVARQKANHHLVMQVGDQFVAGEPELVIGARMLWRVPVRYAPSRMGVLGVVGHLLVDADNGEVTLADDQSDAQFHASAEALYERAASAPRT